MAQATGLTFKTIEKMRARIYAAVGNYRGPNTVFGKRVSGYVREQRPKSYQRAPKVRKRHSEEIMRLQLRRYYAWRKKNPLGEPIVARGVLAELDKTGRDDLLRTERVLLQLLAAQPVEMGKRRQKSKKLIEPHLGWLKEVPGPRGG